MCVCLVTRVCECVWKEKVGGECAQNRSWAEGAFGGIRLYELKVSFIGEDVEEVECFWYLGVEFASAGTMWMKEVINWKPGLRYLVLWGVCGKVYDSRAKIGVWICSCLSSIVWIWILVCKCIIIMKKGGNNWGQYVICCASILQGMTWHLSESEIVSTVSSKELYRICWNGLITWRGWMKTDCCRSMCQKWKTDGWIEWMRLWDIWVWIFKRIRAMYRIEWIWLRFVGLNEFDWGSKWGLR